MCIFPGTGGLDAIENEGLRPDVVFTDIQMPGLSGLGLAVKLRTACPSAKVIFVTGYNEYAFEAYQLHAHGYVMKPLRTERVREELAYLAEFTALPPKPEALTVRCFGYFEVFRNGEPLIFARSKTKELFAFLVDRRGSACTSEEAAAALYEDSDPENTKKTKQSIRNLINDMKSTLNRIGMGDVLIRKGTSIALRTELLDCDYLRMTAGDMDAVNSFRGEYMEQYSWAELTKGTLAFDRH